MIYQNSSRFSQTLTPEVKVSKIFMIGEKYGKKLAKLDIITVENLLYHFPARYDDFSRKTKISQIVPGQKTTVFGQVTQFQNTFTRYGKTVQKGTISDNTGTAQFIFFNQPYLSNVFKIGQNISLAGMATTDYNRLMFTNPEYEILNTAKPKFSTIHTGRLVPVYPETYGVSSKWLRSRLAPLISQNQIKLTDWLPSNLKNKYRLLELNQAIRQIHFPGNESEIVQAKKRLAFDELFLLQLAGFHRRRQWQKQETAIALVKKTKQLNQFIAGLPFKLTKDQKEAVKTVLADITTSIPANRLIQGDVGAGKTVVAAIASYLAGLNRKKTLLMAPTTILAEQHYQSLRQFFHHTKLHLSLITSNYKKIDPKADVIIGTHALLHRPGLPAPALVIIDEQHRFGVEQRAKLLQFRPRPHLITMTATPIPRTISLALYGDLDLSLIKEMPLGEKKIKTWVVPPAKRNSAYQWVKQQLAEHKSQAFIVCPLIEESEHEKMKDIKAVTKEFENLSKNVFSSLRLVLLHGRMKAKDKEQVINLFQNRQADILVSTPVIEVGIDIPYANIIVIEGAERFGLAQLHQLRGRVGRRSQTSYCLLFTSQNTGHDNRRLKAMETHFSGFELAEIDLKIRGPGEIYGRKQSGFTQLKIASLDDTSTLSASRTAAKEAIEKLNHFPLLQEKLKTFTITDVKPN